tara:strand:+ start:48 stop:314 length:267 start_codon:yes stop_codon:yes gene_type:complete
VAVLVTMVALVVLPVVQTVQALVMAVLEVLVAADQMVLMLLEELVSLDKAMQVKVIHMVFFLVEAAAVLLKLVELMVRDKEEMVLRVH